MYNRINKIEYGGIYMDIVIPKPVNEILTVLYENNYEGYLIGSTVRQLLTGEKPTHYQIVTNAPLNEIERIYKKTYNTFLCGENKSSLGIVNAKYPTEITQYRFNSKTLEEELNTRDFTMNALAFSDEDGLIDYGTGIIDMSNRIIRINGQDDENIKRNPISILKAIRLSAEYAFKIERQTQIYMFENKELLKTVPKERIRDELSKILVTPRADFYIKKYFEIMLEILPELSLLENFNPEDKEHIYDGLEHTLVTVRTIEPNLELRLTMLFHDIAKPLCPREYEGNISYKGHNKKSSDLARIILNNFHFNKRTILKVTKLIEYLDYKLPEQEFHIKEFLHHFGDEYIDDLYKVKKADIYGKSPALVGELDKLNNEYLLLQSIIRKPSYIKRNKLKISGKELIEYGIPQEDIGRILNELYLKVLVGEIKNSSEKLNEYVKSYYIGEPKQDLILKKTA